MERPSQWYSKIRQALEKKMTTKIYFKVTWIFKDGRSSVASDFDVDIYKDVFESIPNTDFEEGEHIFKTFYSALCEAFPDFDSEEYKMTSLGKISFNLNSFNCIFY